MLEIEENLLEQKKLTGVSKFPFIMVDMFTCKYSIGSFRNILKTKVKKREMVDIFIPYDSVIKASQTGLILCSKLYEINKEVIENRKKELLNSVMCADYNEYFTNIKKILKDKHYTYKSFLDKKKTPYMYHKNTVSLEKITKNEHIKIMSIFQKIISIEILNKDIFEKIMYLPCFIDNRGRQYYSTLVSPTFYVLFRYLYKFSVKKTFVNLEGSKFYEKISKYAYLVENFNLNSTHAYIALVLFIETGKFFIRNNDDCVIKTENIIKSGIDNYKIKNMSVNFENTLYLKYIYFLLDRLLIEKVVEENSIIFKDATASGLQNYGILLGYKEEKLKYLNINSDD